LNIPTVLVPRNPGLASAFGQLRVEIRDDYQRAILKKHSEVTPEALESIFGEMERQARETLAREGVGEGEITFERTLDLKYYPQTTYLNFPVRDGRLGQEVIDQAVEMFLARHEQEFGYSVSLEFTTVEFVNARLTATGPAPTGELKETTETGTAEEAHIGSRKVHFAEAGGWIDTETYDRDRLRRDATFDGPAIVEQADSTTVVPPGARVEVDGYGNLVMDVRDITRP
jgi:N-methylhydantoinase A